MKLQTAYSYLVKPGKKAAKSEDEKSPKVKGTKIPLSKESALTSLLKSTFEKSRSECNVEFVFTSEDQAHPCRALIAEFLKKPTSTNGRKLAERLRDETSNTSGLGLFFAMIGESEGGDTRLVMSRFPADSGIVAKGKGDTLNVELIEEVFMKSRTKYKAVVFEGQSTSEDFWQGAAVDRQLNGVKGVSDYWISGFLDAKFRTPGVYATKRFAKAIQDAVNKSTEAAVRNEIINASRLVPNLNGQAMSPKKFASRFALSKKATKHLQQVVPKNVFEESFRFSAKVFSKEFAYQSVELDNRGILTAPANDFDKIFDVTLDQTSQTSTYSTKGKVVNERIRKSK